MERFGYIYDTRKLKRSGLSGEITLWENLTADYHTFMLAHKNDPTTLTSDTKFRDYYHHYWKRNQMSDHYPVWIEIEIDSSDDFLEDRLSMLNN